MQEDGDLLSSGDDLYEGEGQIEGGRCYLQYVLPSSLSSEKTGGREGRKEGVLMLSRRRRRLRLLLPQKEKEAISSIEKWDLFLRGGEGIKSLAV